ncbi:hypothetical protein F4775DRAFT_136390 [Biscogniauxia sp. FL1348]|nr:hypothetical protein F4775DRAFT_136390 [Biscogniauxia sp. FL1348]
MPDQGSIICSIQTCRREALPGRKRCERCTLSQRRYRQRLVAQGRPYNPTAARWHAMGLCYNCGAEPSDGKTLQGKNCKAKAAERRRKRPRKAKVRKDLGAVEENRHDEVVSSTKAPLASPDSAGMPETPQSTHDEHHDTTVIIDDTPNSLPGHQLGQPLAATEEPGPPRICTNKHCSREAPPKRKRCEPCRLRSMESHKRYAEKKLKEGKCQRCTNPRDGDTMKCTACRDKTKEVTAQYRRKKQAEPKDPRLCTNPWCERETLPGRKLCEHCRLTAQTSRKERAAKRLELELCRNRDAEPRDADPEDDQPNHQQPEPLLVAESSSPGSFAFPLRPRNTFWDVAI